MGITMFIILVIYLMFYIGKDNGISIVTLGTSVIIVFFTFLLLAIGNSIWKYYIKKKAYMIIFQKYRLYKDKKYVIFEVVHPLMTGSCNPYEYCTI
ncbi:MAG: hypothetical protein K2J20_05155, partial [Bacilli bacterium]|nr:hypothetical protein [Bacilli bacterium]